MRESYVHPRPKMHPVIYAYEDKAPGYEGLLKVGYTARSAEERVAEIHGVKQPRGAKPYRIRLVESAMYPDGGVFRDGVVHRKLREMGVPRVGGEWFRCDSETVRRAVEAVRSRTAVTPERMATFRMRPEQEEAVAKTVHHFQSVEAEGLGRPARFLWNCKMRFGKTFAAYQLARRMGFQRILILTFKPAVLSAWQDDLLTHVDFDGWQLITRDGDLTYETADKSRPIVCFGSFQDYMRPTRDGGIKPRNEWVHTSNWDLVIFDEYHFGAWRDNAQHLFEQFEQDEEDTVDQSPVSDGNFRGEDWLPITASHYLYLSGTPFRALHSGEFIEEQIYNWTYSDEQRAKRDWPGTPDDNPYLALPRMVMLVYQIPEGIREIARKGEFDEFDLGEFFKASGKGKSARFVHEDAVQQWLDLLRGQYLGTTEESLRGEGTLLPYGNVALKDVLQHTLWYLPGIASCEAMANLLRRRQNVFYHDYRVILCAGSQAGNGKEALDNVLQQMGNDPLRTKSITLTCGKLVTGVTVRPWTGIFMLRPLQTPETYFQAAFRVQSPWEVVTETGKRVILKRECYVFDFDINRALRQISDYSRRLSFEEQDPEKRVEEFIRFLPVLAYQGGGMAEINAAEILDLQYLEVSGTQLAKRWQSPLLVNVDNETLDRLLRNKEAMDALMQMEGFRSLGKDIETVINQSEDVKQKRSRGDLTRRERKEISDEEKEYKSRRKQIQEKLLKFVTRVPLFMYLTDYREICLQDVIMQLEPGLFKRVTGLDTDNFRLLLELGIFNDALMNDAIYKFKRYEDASLAYIDLHRETSEDETVGGWDSTLTTAEYQRMYGEQQHALETPPVSIRQPR